ncbi:MAG: sodium:calcium antiporter [Candidatus Diapherotrites archaeon]|nr:sodium:calcium antiporter [Candidatus Diapherotrites archaeon]
MFDFVVLVAGLALLVMSSKYAVESAVRLSGSLRVSPILIGVLVVSVGTSLPEISTSIMSALLGHGDIVAGNALGSCLSQITLILAVAIIFAGVIRGWRNDVIVLGGAMLVAEFLAVITVEKGFISRFDGVILVAAFFALLLVATRHSAEKFSLPALGNGSRRDFGVILLSLAGLLVGANLTVTSAVSLAVFLGVPEFLVGFFAVALGTSLPELVFDVTALRRGEYELVIGDMLGSNLTNATLALGIGPIFLPVSVSSALLSPFGWYVLVVSAMVVFFFAWRERLGRQAAFGLLALYLLSYLL